MAYINEYEEDFKKKELTPEEIEERIRILKGIKEDATNGMYFGDPGRMAGIAQNNINLLMKGGKNKWNTK